MDKRFWLIRAAMLLLGLMTFLSYFAVRMVSKSYIPIVETHKTIYDVKHSYSDTMYLQSVLRSYIIIGQQQYIDEYEAKKPNMNYNINYLKTHYTNNKDIVEYSKMLETKREFFEAMIDDYEKGNSNFRDLAIIDQDLTQRLYELNSKVRNDNLIKIKKYMEEAERISYTIMYSIPLFLIIIVVLLNIYIKLEDAMSVRKAKG